MSAQTNGLPASCSQVPAPYNITFVTSCSWPACCAWHSHPLKALVVSAGPAKASSATQTKGAPQENGVAVPDSEALQERIQDLEGLLQVSCLLNPLRKQVCSTAAF